MNNYLAALIMTTISTLLIITRKKPLIIIGVAITYCSWLAFLWAHKELEEKND